MMIKGKNYLLREWKGSDAESIAKHANNKKVFDNLRDGFPYPYTVDDAKKWIEQVKQVEGPTRFFAIEVDGIAVGSIGIVLKEDVYRKNAEIGYFIGEKYWNKGIMTAVIKDIVKYIFETFSEVIRIYAEPFEYNQASMRVLEKAGFQLDAVLRKYVVKNENNERIYLFHSQRRIY